jgi:hypothetical protein
VITARWGKRNRKVASHQATEKKLDNFKKAFAVCLEAKYYMVK